jgi:hypothetical protein
VSDRRRELAWEVVVKTKSVKLRDVPLKSLAEDQGMCFATDLITVEGEQVGYMYRERPDNEVDSGWRFLAGTESEEYINNPDNLAIYDVNTIANYDPEIVPFLDAPIGSAFERESESGRFVEVDPPRSEPSGPDRTLN